METINNNTCRCDAGYYGPQCQFGKPFALVASSCVSDRVPAMVEVGWDSKVPAILRNEKL